MEASKNPDYLRAVSDAVVEFRNAFERFLNLHVVNDTLARGIAPAVFPREDIDSKEITAAAQDVALAAGRASAAAGLTKYMIRVQGTGLVDPIAAWHSITQPKPVLEASDILSACDQMIGRFEDMIRRAEVEAPPQIGAEAMHPLIWGAARRLWRDGHFRQAVAAAAESLITQVKIRTERNDVSETALWAETFSDKDPTQGKPRLRWPGDPKDREVKAMNEGLRQFAPGVQLTIRNRSVHGIDELNEQDALERLATMSLLARWVDKCELVRHQS